jgi:hypothetical protein
VRGPRRKQLLTGVAVAAVAIGGFVLVRSGALGAGAHSDSPVVTVGDRTDDELTPIDITLDVTAPGGRTPTVQVTGLPKGLSAKGARITGTISPDAATGTPVWTDLASVAHHVTVVVTDSAGRQTSQTFAWTVRDTHLVMADYVDKYGCGNTCGEDGPQLGALNHDFKAACDGPDQNLVWRQSIAPGEVIRWDQPVTIWYGKAPGAPCVQIEHGW